MATLRKSGLVQPTVCSVARSQSKCYDPARARDHTMIKNIQMHEIGLSVHIETRHVISSSRPLGDAGATGSASANDKSMAAPSGAELAASVANADAGGAASGRQLRQPAGNYLIT